MQQERLIRKYSNRRLYDTGGSRHVTLEDLRQLIVAGEKIKVVDDKSGEDLTRLGAVADHLRAGAVRLSRAGRGTARNDHPLLWRSDASAAQPLSRTGVHHDAAAAGGDAVGNGQGVADAVCASDRTGAQEHGDVGADAGGDPRRIHAAAAADELRKLRILQRPRTTQIDPQSDSKKGK